MNGIGGSIIPEQITSLPDPKKIDAIPDQSQHQPRGRGSGFKKREEEKLGNIQPRQMNRREPQTNETLMVKNRYGKFEPVEDWFSNQVEQGKASGKNIIEIYDKSGKKVYIANLIEKMSYRYNHRKNTYEKPRNLEYRN